MAESQSTQKLQGRINLALSILDQRECSPSNWSLALSALKGASVTELQAMDGDA